MILAEVGADMAQFPSADHLISWAGMCPGNNQSGGKRRNGRTRKGNQALRAALVTSGQAAGRSKETYLGALFRRIASRRGSKRAAMAVGRHILQSAYYILRDGTTYRELGANYYDERRKGAVTRSAVKRLERLGYTVTLGVACFALTTLALPSTWVQPAAFSCCLSPNPAPEPRAGPFSRESGRHVEEAGVFRDPVRSTGSKIFYTFGLNVVLLCDCVRVPGRDQPVALPVHARVYVKGGPSHVMLTALMVQELAGWLPDRHFRLLGDGAYASLAKFGLPRTVVTSRLRRDAVLFDLPPARRPGQRGRPPKKGQRLPSLERIAAAAALHQGHRARVRLRDHTVDRLLLRRVTLWYQVTGALPLHLVIVRDPAGHEHDDSFFTTDIDAEPAAVVAEYADRWSIELTFPEVKQHLTPQHLQSWRRCGPGRNVTVGFWLYSPVWLWFLQAGYEQRAWPHRPWYTRKCSPSFADALAALRVVLWRTRFAPAIAAAPEFAKMADAAIAALARAG